MDIDEARRLANLPANLVNQVFLKLSDMAQTESVKNRIAAWMPHASVTSPGTMLQLFGGVSQTIGRFRSVAVAGRRTGGAGAWRHLRVRQSGRAQPRARDPARASAGSKNRCGARSRRKWRCKDCSPALSRLACWRSAAICRAYQHQSAGQPARRESGQLRCRRFHLGASTVALPVTLTAWDWLSGPIVATFALGLCGWWMAADRKSRAYGLRSGRPETVHPGADGLNECVSAIMLA